MEFVLAANHRFKDHTIGCIDSIRRFNYDHYVYDLGYLGFGTPAIVLDEGFHATGCYRTQFTKWRSRGMHTPEIVSRHLYHAKGTVAYVDADTRLLGRVPEINDVQFDVGVTVRHEDEMENLGRCNSGVIFFRPTQAAKEFVLLWKQLTKNTGSVQAGLNEAITYPGCSIAEFPTDIYNYYYSAIPPATAKILHYRASMTDYPQSNGQASQLSPPA